MSAAAVTAAVAHTRRDRGRIVDLIDRDIRDVRHIVDDGIIDDRLRQAFGRSLHSRGKAIFFNRDRAATDIAASCNGPNRSLEIDRLRSRRNVGGNGEAAGNHAVGIRRAGNGRGHFDAVELHIVERFGFNEPFQTELDLTLPDELGFDKMLADLLDLLFQRNTRDVFAFRRLESLRFR